MILKSRPGPLGKSCLTCKRRHKKCDQRQPICKRCEVGGFQCLGYEHNRRGIVHTSWPESLHQLAVPNNRISSPDLTLSVSQCDQGATQGVCLSEEQPGDTSTTPLQLELSIPHTLNEAIDNSIISDKFSTPGPVSSRTCRVEDYLRLFASISACKSADGPLSILHKIINLQAQLYYSPLDPLKTFFNSQWIFEYLLEQSDKMMDRWYFKPTNYLRKHFQKNVIIRLQNSNLTRWIALVGMGVLESFITGDMSQICLHNSWIGYIEGSLKQELSLDLSPQAIRDRLSDWVHITLLKTMLIHSSNTYKVLRGITPAFLQLAFSNPTLWSRNRGLTSVPLSTILTCEAHELSYFALIDCTCAMALGLPQQIEYDTTIHSSSSNYSSHQWAHSSPTEFQLALADINACRDQSPHSRDWREIEKCLVEWRSQPCQYTFTESWMTVAWYAVQESWRLALLAYLYMAVCNTPSDDIRVQTCIKQVLQIIGTVRQDEPSDLNLSFFVHYLIVGICARSEAHRKIVRDKLSDLSVTKLWVMRASDFVPVLDHLWHGAAAGGRPVRWGDYKLSREAMLPVIS
ncbi:hypothetical protein OPQ81_000359 [Rhizoctonia solani]|nr:hypothetical protein OPQ81_000359 [Rhizoctonia solani]